MLSNTLPIPLTSSQLPLWLGQRLAPDSPMYNMAMAIHLPAGVQVALFQEAWQKLVAENDALRLRFSEAGGVPGQTLVTTAPTLELIDLRELSANELEVWLSERTRQKLDLAVSPVDTALLLTQTGDIWYLNQHHLITDAWGVTAQVQRLSELYQGLVDDRAPEATALPSFVKYAQLTPGEPDNRTQDYWKEVAQKLPALAGFNRYEKDTTEISQRVEIPVDEVLRQQISKALSQPEFSTWTPQLTEFNLLSTALFAFLHRLTGEEALAIGTPAHNRLSAADKRTPGVFMELFPLVVDIDGQDSFLELYAKVRDANYGLLRYAKPGAGNSQLARGYNVVINFINTPMGDFAGEPVKVEWIHPRAADAGHELRMLVYDFSGEGTPKFFFELNEAVFSPQQRRNIPRQFARLFTELLATPGKAIGRPPLAGTSLPASSLQVDGYDYDLTVLDLLAQVPLTPQVALQEDGKQLSYQDLHLQVEKLAGFLITCGVQKGDLVPVVLNRTTDYLVSLLAILKIGAAFVPIAVTNPKGRIAQLLEELDSKVVLSHRNHSELLPEPKEGVVWLDEEARAIAESSVDHLQLASRRARPEDLAYVLYTSGSTGRPKGVMISHRALSLYLQYARVTYACGARVTAPLFTSIGFDLTITSTFLPLITGGTLRLYPAVGSGPDLSLLEVLRDGGIDFLKLTPAHLRLLGTTETTVNEVKALVVGGENFTTGAAEVARKVFGPSVAIFNEYGPTEATVGCVVHEVIATSEQGSSVPIGTAMPFVGALVLDAFHNSVPDGVIGELFLEGKTLAEGYFQRSELTDLSFVKIAGRRLYATGDLVSRHPETQNLIYHGRKDEQVKIGGQRVEPAEIARMLEQQPQVNSAIVIPSHRIDEEGENYLLAYCTGAASLDLQKALTQLRLALPPYMVPRQIIRLEQFPLNANGKINYRELPLPTGIYARAHTEYTEPRDEFDDLIAACWAAVFSVEQLSIEANFFDLGGDSLKAIRIISRLNDELELDFPVNLLFRYPTIASLSDYIQDHMRELLSQMEE